MKKEVVNILYSIMFSLAFVISIVYYNTLWFEGENYTAGLLLDYINAKTTVLFLIITCLCYIVVRSAEKIIGRLRIINIQNNAQSSKKIFLISFGCNLMIWGIWFLVFAPGTGMNDTLNILMTSYNNDNCPIVYQILIWYGIKIMKYLFDDIAFGYGCLVWIQMIVSASVFSSVIKWLAEKGLKKKIICILIIYYSLLPVIANYSITLVKDTLYAVFLLKLIVLLYDIVESRGEVLKKNSNFIKTIFVSIAVCCFRSNGAIVCIVSLIITLFVIGKEKKRFLLLIISVLLVNGGIGRLEQAHFNADTKFREASGVLVVQIGAVLNDSEANIDEADLKELNKLLPVETWKDNYRPSFVDTVKLDKDFNNNWLNDNKVEFIKIWFKIMLKNFPTYVRAYICHSYGFWGILKYPPDMTQSYFTSINNNTSADSVWGMFCEKNDLLNQSVLPQQVSSAFEKIFESSIKHNFTITPGIMIWIVFFCVTILIWKKKYIECVPCLPLIFTWGTMMIASPASLIYRYSYYLVLALPIIIIMTIIQGAKSRE